MRNSLTLLEFLAKYEVYPTCVLGVKMDPFAAHAWVQQGSMVLTDPIAHVKTFTPIMSVQVNNCMQIENIPFGTTERGAANGAGRRARVRADGGDELSGGGPRGGASVVDADGGEVVHRRLSAPRAPSTQLTSDKLATLRARKMATTPHRSLEERNMIRSPLLPALLLSLFVSTATGAPAPLHFEIPAGDAEKTLLQVLSAAHVEMLFRREQVQGVRTNAVNGEFTPREALEKMLAGTPLELRFSDDDTFVAVARLATSKSPAAR